MKKLFALALFVLSAQVLVAQTISPDRVPSTVKNKMEEKYPEAKGVLWRQSDPGFVEANFSNEGRKCSAIFLASGGWVSTDCEIEETEMPEAARAMLAKPENADKVSKYYRSETKAKGTQYSSDVKKGGKSLQYIFDKDGNLIMKGPKS